MGNEKVDAVLANLETAPIDEPLRATLAFLRKVTREHAAVTPEDIQGLLAQGLSRAKIEDALAVGWCFNAPRRYVRVRGRAAGIVRREREGAAVARLHAVTDQ